MKQKLRTIIITDREGSVPRSRVREVWKAIIEEEREAKRRAATEKRAAKRKAQRKANA